MGDNELDAIRAKRMAEMQQQQQQQGSAGMDQQQSRQEAAERDETMKNSILSQVLDQNARARLSNIAVAKPDKARSLENMIIQMARYGQIQGKMGDEQLKSLLDQVSEKMQKTTTVKFDRRRVDLDSDSD
uniref:Programmed cell death protein 5 n=1 Tax=Plectus sambesii TaxID=2011161 RepID=A0A914WK03_9BILA